MCLHHVHLRLTENDIEDFALTIFIKSKLNLINIKIKADVMHCLM